MTIAQKLSEFIYNTNYKDIPVEVHRYVKLCILDWLGVVLGGSTEKSGTIIFNSIKEMGGEKQATILGKGIKTNVLFVALVNGTMSHALDFDDTLTVAAIHPSVCLAPAIMAVGEYKKVNGKDLITAFTVGFEIAARIGIAAGVSHYYKGFHATSTVGRFGAMAGVAKLLGITPNIIVNAFGITGTQVSGLRQVFGTMCKPFHAGKAAMDGILSAFLAQKGFDSSDTIFEGEFGLINVYGTETDQQVLFENLGKNYQIVNVAFKPYASALATHSTIEAIKDIKTHDFVTADNVNTIELEMGDLPMSVVNKSDPRHILEGKFSVHHCAALAFIENSVGQDMFTEEKLNDNRIIEFRKKIKTVLNADYKQFETRIVVTTKDGRLFERFIKIPRGLSENPMTFDDMKEKFKGLVSSDISETNINKIIEAIRHLPELSDIGEIIALCNGCETIG